MSVYSWERQEPTPAGHSLCSRLWETFRTLFYLTLICKEAERQNELLTDNSRCQREHLDPWPFTHITLPHRNWWWLNESLGYVLDSWLSASNHYHPLLGRHCIAEAKQELHFPEFHSLPGKSTSELSGRQRRSRGLFTAAVILSRRMGRCGFTAAFHPFLRTSPAVVFQTEIMAGGFSDVHTLAFPMFTQIPDDSGKLSIPGAL